MKSPMLPAEHQAAVRRALALGRSGDPAVLPELIGMLRLPSHEVQRLASSGIGRFAEFGADAQAAVAVLAPVALRAPHPQTQQYAIRALGKYGASAKDCVRDLRDLAHNPAQRDYARMYKKQMLYQQEGKRLISVYPADLPRLDQLLRKKLGLLGCAVVAAEIA